MKTVVKLKHSTNNRRYSVSRKKTDIQLVVSISLDSYILLKKEAEKRGIGQLYSLIAEAIENSLSSTEFNTFFRKFKSERREKMKTVKLVSLKDEHFKMLNEFINSSDVKTSISELIDACITFHFSQN
ncbi:hypothetical protein [Thermococcus sp. GR6]|uniref:hypothetical protein n=1 Tax=Thermococcus sp. GR6 TaxID=1638256 RepID=UPI00142FAB29|nr:hypothetical protein [Thermococcus sp. GR6]NJE41844.1 hypothetical protein [Thermococcus sp. GR6]